MITIIINNILSILIGLLIIIIPFVCIGCMRQDDSYAICNLRFSKLENDFRIPILYNEFGMPIIEAEINGYKGRFLLDTGCTGMVITNQCVEKCGIKLMGDCYAEMVLGDGSMWRTYGVTSKFSIKIGLANVECNGIAVRDVKTPDWFGIIGFTFFKMYNATIDLEKDVIVFKAS